MTEHPSNGAHDRRLASTMRTIRVPGGRTSSPRAAAPRTLPAVSLVVAMSKMNPTAESALAAVVAESVRTAVELVVACTATRRSLDTLRRRHPSVRFSTSEAPVAAGDLRAMGLRDATGEIVVLLDDTADAATVEGVATLLASTLSRAAGPACTRSAAWNTLLPKLVLGQAASGDATPPAPSLATPHGRGVAATSIVAGS